MEYKIVMPSGIVFDFSNMVGAGRLQAQEVEQALQQQGAVAEKAVCELRSTGFSKNHLSKDARRSMYTSRGCHILLTATPIRSSRLLS